MMSSFVCLACNNRFDALPNKYTVVCEICGNGRCVVRASHPLARRLD